MCWSGTILSTAPALIASFGMPNTTHVASSCATVAAPACLMARSPCAPSPPMPVKITPRAFEPAVLAMEWNMTSTEGRCRFTGGPCVI